MKNTRHWDGSFHGEPDGTDVEHFMAKFGTTV